MPLSHSPKLGAIGGLFASLATSVPVSPGVPAQGSHEGRVFCPYVHKEYLGVGYLMRVRPVPNRHPERAGFGLYFVVGWGINNKKPCQRLCPHRCGLKCHSRKLVRKDSDPDEDRPFFQPNNNNSLQHHCLFVQRFS